MATVTGFLFTALAGIFLLGAIVFIHELGHFFVAKACGVRVLVFSLGFGPKLFGVRLGETEYRVCVLPLGGYVQMFGDDITEDIAPEELRYSFLHKSIPQRMAIAAAGPIANFILPVILFFGLNIGTHDVAAPQVGTVIPNEPAALAGLQAGDTLVSIDGEAIRTFSDIQEYVEVRPNQEVTIVVRRASSAGDVEKSFQVKTRGVKGTNLLSPEEEKGRVGIVTSERLPWVHLVGINALEKGSTLETGDLVTKVNGVAVRTFGAYERAIASADQTQPLNLEIESYEVKTADDDDKQEKTPKTLRNVTLKAAAAAVSDVEMTLIQFAVTRDELAFEKSATMIAQTRTVLSAEVERIRLARGMSTLEGTIRGIDVDTVAKSVGLKPGDRIVSIDGFRLTHAGEISSRLFEAPRAVHVVGVISGRPLPLPIAPKSPDKSTDKSMDESADKSVVDGAGKTVEVNEESLTPSHRIVVFRMLPATAWGMEDFRVFGVQAATAFAAPPLVKKEVGVLEALSMAKDQTFGLVRDTAVGLVKLATGKFSVKSMGGPITIFSLAGKAANRGLADFIFLMAFISVNLGIVNLLPVPVLDGGHLLLFSIEAVRRKRMSLAAQEKLLKIGLSLLGLLMVVALFNDLMRAF